MNTIEVPESHRCTVVGLSFRMQCVRCGLVWDIYVPIEDTTPPDLWDVCRNCLAKLDKAPTETSTKYEYRYTKILAKYPYLNRG